ncbi:hypothetical protein B296_00035334 [Ensete ventricosum]|uniref:Uncharacterized protein n=1 Tax=Ensete ventricosum TaxID=4639 RepID=A0A426WWZ0_ENSVE|nr:hypothetical protein B296_00035334 [Ensete ventricosum]
MPNSLLMSFCTPVFMGQCEPLPEMVKGVMLRARVLYRPPMTSLRRGNGKARSSSAKCSFDNMLPLSDGGAAGGPEDAGRSVSISLVPSVEEA